MENYSYDFESLSNSPNSPDVDGKYLGQISSDFILVSDVLKDASYQIRKRGFSDYPIFVVSKLILKIGSLLLGPTDLHNQWTYYASYLADFKARDLITEHQEPLFRDSYKDPEEFCCLFVIDGDFAKFVFIPYPED
jgi:hypothetical protein